MHILVVEDEAKVASFIRRGLEAEHYSVDITSDGEAGLTQVFDQDYDLIILDVMLPKRDGLSVIGELRAKKVETPVLILSALGQVDDRVKGLRACGCRS